MHPGVFSRTMLVSVRDFQLNAAKYLQELPITLTRYGRPVADVVPPGLLDNTPEKKVTESISLPPRPRPPSKAPKSKLSIPRKVGPVTAAPICKHGSMIGLCKFSCKK